MINTSYSRTAFHLGLSFEPQTDMSFRNISASSVDSFERRAEINALQFGLDESARKITNSDRAVSFVDHPEIDLRIYEYKEVIPAAVAPMSSVLLKHLNDAGERAELETYDSDIDAVIDDPDKNELRMRFNRRERIKAFYFLMTLIDGEKDLPGLEHYPLPGPGVQDKSRGQEQLYRMYSVMHAVENEATVKAKEYNKALDAEFPDVIDPKTMHVQVQHNYVFRLKDGKMQDTGERLEKSMPYLSAEDRIIVVPSTCEYTLVDAYGRIMVIRVKEGILNKPRLFPYKNIDAKNINEALEHGKIVFSLPKEGRDLLDRPLRKPYIDEAWQLSTEQKERMAKSGHSMKMAEIFEGLSPLPYESGKD